jgi:hypothetical protein
MLPLLAVLLLGAGPVEERHGSAVIDWTERTVRVTGVAAARILSPTGSLVPQEPTELARADVVARLEAALGRVAVDAERLASSIEAVSARIPSEARTHEIGSIRQFSDGSVHVPASASFAWMAPVLGPPSEPSFTGPLALPPDLAPAGPSTGADAGAGAATDGGAPIPDAALAPAGHTGVVVLVRGTARPAVRVLLEEHGGDRSVEGGLPIDPVGSDGVVWVRSKNEALAHPSVGGNPLVVDARASRKSKRGVLRVDGKAAGPLFDAARIPGGLVVVVR